MRLRHLALTGIAALGAFGLVGACVSLDGVASGGGADAAEASDGVDTGIDAGEVPESTPGVVICGPTPCTLPSSCCATVPSAPGGPIPTVCQASTESCAGYAITCDERADCAKGESCCIGLGDGGDRRAACARACPTIQACRTDGECLDGKTCKHLTCFGLRLWVCGPNTLCSAN
jgi:hypothetical protein